MALNGLVWEASWRPIMGKMMKGSELKAAGAQGTESESARRRGSSSDKNPAFVRAFADALRDILREEQQSVA